MTYIMSGGALNSTQTKPKKSVKFLHKIILAVIVSNRDYV